MTSISQGRLGEEQKRIRDFFAELREVGLRKITFLRRYCAGRKFSIEPCDAVEKTSVENDDVVIPAQFGSKIFFEHFVEEQKIICESPYDTDRDLCFNAAISNDRDAQIS